MDDDHDDHDHDDDDDEDDDGLEGGVQQTEVWPPFGLLLQTSTATNVFSRREEYFAGAKIINKTTSSDDKCDHGNVCDNDCDDDEDEDSIEHKSPIHWTRATNIHCDKRCSQPEEYLAVAENIIRQQYHKMTNVLIVITGDDEDSIERSV